MTLLIYRQSASPPQILGNPLWIFFCRMSQSGAPGFPCDIIVFFLITGSVASSETSEVTLDLKRCGKSSVQVSTALRRYYY